MRLEKCDKPQQHVQPVPVQVDVSSAWQSRQPYPTSLSVSSYSAPQPVLKPQMASKMAAQDVSKLRVSSPASTTPPPQKAGLKFCSDLNAHKAKSYTMCALFFSVFLYFTEL